MKKVLVLVSLVLCLAAAVQATTGTEGDTIWSQPNGDQDGSVYSWDGTGYVWAENTSIVGWMGTYNNSQMAMIAIMDLPEMYSEDVVSAYLVVPQQDNVWVTQEEGYPEGYNIAINHIDATNDGIIRQSDMDESRDLGVIGTLRAAGPVVFNETGYVVFNVTAQVKADLDAERASFAFKTVTENTGSSLSNYFMYPTVENTWYDNPDTTLWIATPEPATIALLLVGGLSMLRRKKA